jgi:hypothetical protein
MTIRLKVLAHHARLDLPLPPPSISVKLIFVYALIGVVCRMRTNPPISYWRALWA